ncbi:hypothetical protein AVE44_26215 [Salmonella enterica subsp. enterica serovar Typhimurium]|nr:hypothetical protein [Salmonella enterica subsp. enterica serovar Typhimurium]
MTDVRASNQALMRLKWVPVRVCRGRVRRPSTAYCAQQRTHRATRRGHVRVEQECSCRVSASEG